MKLLKSFRVALVSCLSILSCASAAFSQEKISGIHFFNGTLKEAFAKAKEEKKAIFFDAYASWCGPCKHMDAEVYTDAAIGEFFDEHFVSIRVDMEKGEGPDIAKKMPSIDGFPSLIFFSNDGHVIKTILGSRSKDALLNEARYALIN